MLSPIIFVIGYLIVRLFKNLKNVWHDCDICMCRVGVREKTNIALTSSDKAFLYLYKIFIVSTRLFKIKKFNKNLFISKDNKVGRYLTQMYETVSSRYLPIDGPQSKNVVE